MESSTDELRSRCESLGQRAQVWYRHSDYVVRNYTPDLEESVLRHMASYFVPDAPYSRSAGVATDPASMADMVEMYRRLLRKNHNLTVIALPKGAAGADLQPVHGGVVPLAGVNILYLVHKGELLQPLDQFTGAAARKVRTIVRNISDAVDCFSRYNVQHIVESSGLSVHPDHRRRGVGMALLQARLALCESIGVRVTKSVYTAQRAQNLARNCDFRVVHEVLTADIRNAEGEKEFPDIDPEHRAFVMVRAFNRDLFGPEAGGRNLDH